MLSTKPTKEYNKNDQVVWSQIIKNDQVVVALDNDLKVTDDPTGSGSV